MPRHQSPQVNSVRMSWGRPKHQYFLIPMGGQGISCPHVDWALRRLRAQRHGGGTRLPGELGSASQGAHVAHTQRARGALSEGSVLRREPAVRPAAWAGDSVGRVGSEEDLCSQAGREQTRRSELLCVTDQATWNPVKPRTLLRKTFHISQWG